MNNFTFYNPTKIIFGKNQIKGLSKEVSPYKKILFIYGKGSIKDNGIFDTVTLALKDQKVVEFHGIEPNPQYETLMRAVELGRKEEVDFILAVGGGSVIDAGKFIAAAIPYTGIDPWDMLSKNEKVLKTIDLGCVLTLPATGSEMNCFSVISRDKRKLGLSSEKLFPKFSILDPEVTFSLGERQLGNGVVDAFVHVIEQYLTYKVDAPVQERFSEALLKTLLETGPRVIHLKDDYASRANHMWCSTLALNGLIGLGVPQDWTTHLIGHELTALYGIDHARTLAVLLPAVLKYKFNQKLEKLDQMGRNVFDLSGGTPESRAKQTIELIEDFFNSMGLPTKLHLYNVNKEDIVNITHAISLTIPFDKGAKLGEKKDISINDIEKILELTFV